MNLPAAAPEVVGPELSVIIPTLNEAANIATLVNKLRQALAGIEWEVTFVDDDSSDGTRAAVFELARDDRRVRLVHRIGRRGLASACIEGVQASTAPYVAIMDADLQHDEALLPQMFATLKAQDADLVVGSRYAAGGNIADWDARRAGISRLATRLGGLILKGNVVADPMSGFFMLRRDTFDGAVRRLSAVGFKILIDILASSKQPLRIRELPYSFRPRLAGLSKLDTMVAWEYVVLVADKSIGRYIPVRFLMFALIGSLGLGLHLIILWSLLAIALSFSVAQSIATGAAMVGNYTLNNLLTYRDRRLRGWGFVRGLVSFALICGVGAAANVGVASFLFGSGRSSWWVAGIAGAAMSSVWNYAVSAVFTWRAR